MKIEAVDDDGIGILLLLCELVAHEDEAVVVPRGPCGHAVSFRAPSARVGRRLWLFHALCSSAAHTNRDDVAGCKATHGDKTLAHRVVALDVNAAVQIGVEAQGEETSGLIGLRMMVVGGYGIDGRLSLLQRQRERDGAGRLLEDPVAPGNEAPVRRMILLITGQVLANGRLPEFRIADRVADSDQIVRADQRPKLPASIGRIQVTPILKIDEDFLDDGWIGIPIAVPICHQLLRSQYIVLAVNVFVKIDNVIYRKLQILVLVTPRLRHPSFDALSLGQAPRDIRWNVGLSQILEDSVPVPTRYAHVVPDADRYP